MLLKGFGFSGYRSIGNELVKIGPLKKVNLIIGQNNVGKSNIVNFLSDQYSSFFEKIKYPHHSPKENSFKDIDHHISNERVQYQVSFPLFYSDIENYINKKFPNEKQHVIQRQLARKVLCSECLMDDGEIWFTHKADNPNGPFELEINVDEVSRILHEREWQHLWHTLTRQTGGGLRQNWIPESLQELALSSRFGS